MSTRVIRCAENRVYIENMSCVRIEHVDDGNRLEPTDWNSAIQELLEEQGVDIKHEMERK
jgi:hypothetical protein